MIDPSYNIIYDKVIEGQIVIEGINENQNDNNPEPGEFDDN